MSLQNHSGMTSSALSSAVRLEGDKEEGVFEGKPRDIVLIECETRRRISHR